MGHAKNIVKHSCFAQTTYIRRAKAIALRCGFEWNLQIFKFRTPRAVSCRASRHDNAVRLLEDSCRPVIIKAKPDPAGMCAFRLPSPNVNAARSTSKVVVKERGQKPSAGGPLGTVSQPKRFIVIKSFIESFDYRTEF